MAASHCALTVPPRTLQSQGGNYTFDVHFFASYCALQSGCPEKVSGGGASRPGSTITYSVWGPGGRGRAQKCHSVRAFTGTATPV
jgi:hypothetical protein